MKSWEQFLKNLEGEFGTDTVNRWLRSLKVVRFDAANLYLEASDSFQAIWFREHIAKRAKDALHVNGRAVRIHLSIKGQLPKQQKKFEKGELTPSYSPDVCEKRFDSWIGTDENLLAFNVLQNINVDKFNPYFLFGKPGSGKTHLLMAAANLLASKGKNVCYVRAETFTAHVVRAIRTGDMDTFRNAYRSIDALFLDDIAVFSGKTATQEEFFHTFNTLHSAGKPIVISGDVPPRGLEGIEDRLISRFEWGISFPLVPLLDVSLLLKKRLEDLPFRLHPTALAFLQTEMTTPESVASAIDTLIYHSKLRGKTAYDKQDLVAILRHIILDQKKKLLTPEKIVESVATYFAQNAEEVRGKGQTKELVLPRQIAMYFLRKELALSYVKIGSFMGRDHSTVMTSVKQIEKNLAGRDETISPAVQAIHQILR